MNLNQIQAKLLQDLTNLHSIPQGAFSLRLNGKTVENQSTKEITITPHQSKQGFEVHIKPKTVGKSLHIPVVIDQNTNEEVFNDFYVGDGCDILIVAGCGIHSNAQEDRQHNGVHSLYIGKNCNVKYVERHLGIGNKFASKILSPTTNIVLGENSTLEIETIQLGGVTFSNRVTNAELAKNAVLIVNEKVLTENKDVTSSSFTVNLTGHNSKCEIKSRSVAKDASCQDFKSTLIGTNLCFGRVECDGIMLGGGTVSSSPTVIVKNREASLSHEAVIGKIAGEQLVKLMSMGLTKEEAENKIITGYLAGK